MAKPGSTGTSNWFGRRGFLKGAAAGAAALVAQPEIGKSQEDAPARGVPPGSGSATPPAERLAREAAGTPVAAKKTKPKKAR